MANAGCCCERSPINITSLLGREGFGGDRLLEEEEGDGDYYDFIIEYIKMIVEETAPAKKLCSRMAGTCPKRQQRFITYVYSISILTEEFQK